MARASDILEIILSAKDQTRQAFSSVTRNINSLSQTIEQNRRGLLRGGSRGGGGDADGGSLMGAIFGNVGGSLVKAGFVLGAVKQIAGQVKDITKAMIAPAARFEQLSTSFEVMLGNASQARALLEDLEQFSATTPFRMEEVAGGARILKVMGTETRNIVGEMRMLGDIAANIPATIEEMAFLFGQSRIEGKLLTRDLRQFATRGIPIFEELANVLGVSKSEIADLTEEGLIGFDALEEAFQNMTSEGGIFFESTKRQSQTLLGLWSTLADNFQLLMKEFAEGELLEDAKGLVKETTTLVQNLKMVVAEIKNIRSAIREMGGTAFSRLFDVDQQRGEEGFAKFFDPLLLPKQMAEFIKIMNGTTAAENENAKAKARLEQATKKLSEVTKEAKKGQAAARLEQEKTIAAQAKAQTLIDRMVKKLDSTKTELAGLISPVDKLKEQFAQLDVEYANLIRTFGDRLSDDQLLKATRTLNATKEVLADIAKQREKVTDDSGKMIDSIIRNSKTEIERIAQQMYELGEIMGGEDLEKSSKAFRAFNVLRKKLEDIKKSARDAVRTFGDGAKSPFEQAKNRLIQINEEALKLKKNFTDAFGVMDEATKGRLAQGQAALVGQVLRDLIPESGGPAGLPTAQDARFLTGIAAQANEQARAQATRQKQLRATQKTNDLIKQLPADIAEKISAFIPKALTPITG